jgi:hypothetical protein
VVGGRCRGMRFAARAIRRRGAAFACRRRRRCNDRPAGRRQAAKRRQQRGDIRGVVHAHVREVVRRQQRQRLIVHLLSRERRQVALALPHDFKM